jgi:hypothetical protein
MYMTAARARIQGRQPTVLILEKTIFRTGGGHPRMARSIKTDKCGSHGYRVMSDLANELTL